MNAFVLLLGSVIEIYIWVLIATVIVSWLLAFNLLNINSNIVQGLHRALQNLTEPVLRPIRRFLPSFGGIDISPLVLILLLVFLERLLIEMLYG